MTKEQKIQEAFGKSWSLLSHSMQQHILNVHHWVDRSLNRMAVSPLDLGFDEETECEIHHEFWRPKSLAGIENNNGWIKIETEDDLPDEGTLNHVFWNGKILLLEFLKDHSKQKAFKEWSEKGFTHYRPIHQPKHPVY